MAHRVRIGTRGSRLARWQAESVRDLLVAHHPGLEVEVVIVRTLGDRDQRTPLAQLGGTGVFTKEIEAALRRGECDLAVHSLKDVPTELADEFTMVAMLERADPRDALISRHGLPLDALPRGVAVGTSSLRRTSLLRALRPDLEIRPLRGNLPTRLRAVGVSLDEGKPPADDSLEATLLALCGLERLGLAAHATETLDPRRFLPAPAQGVIGVEVRADDATTAELLAELDHPETRRCASAERTFLRELEGGCRVPIAALSRIEAGAVVLDGAVGDLRGERLLRSEARGPDPTEVGRTLAHQLLDEGGREILAEIRRESA